MEWLTGRYSDCSHLHQPRNLRHLKRRIAKIMTVVMLGHDLCHYGCEDQEDTVKLQHDEY